MRAASRGFGLHSLAVALGAVAAAASGAAIATGDLGRAMPKGDHHKGRTRYVGGYRRHGRSLADGHHDHAREITRRLRQQARDAERQEQRLVARGGSAPDVFAEGVVIGISRRGRFVVV